MSTCSNNISNCKTICSAAGYGSDTSNMVESRLELDSHANMPVVIGGAYIVARAGKTAEVSAYNPDYGSKQMPTVDAALQYDSPYDGQTYIYISHTQCIVCPINE